MIYILTSGEYDLSTDHVIQWLNYYNANYIRINVEELENSKLTKVYIDSHNNLTDITYKDHKIDFSGSNIIWYRRLGIKREDFKYDCELDSENFRKFLEKLGDAIEGPNGTEVLKKLGIDKKATTYVARHTFSTVLKRSGASTEYIQEALGHSDVKTTENYLDSFGKDVKREFAHRLSSFKNEEMAKEGFIE